MRYLLYYSWRTLEGVVTFIAHNYLLRYYDINVLTNHSKFFKKGAICPVIHWPVHFTQKIYLSWLKDDRKIYVILPTLLLMFLVYETLYLLKALKIFGKKNLYKNRLSNGNSSCLLDCSILSAQSITMF